mmetsp:Transcript_23255/g.51484  ORF Transcript_23255/g.51484 Transcript_23255/m.51484 type:complete len:102 (-) Transcript_23255:258-563(-)
MQTSVRKTLSVKAMAALCPSHQATYWGTWVNGPATATTRFFQWPPPELQNANPPSGHNSIRSTRPPTILAPAQCPNSCNKTVPNKTAKLVVHDSAISPALL